MKCEACNGSGQSAKPGQACFHCNGMAEMCDVCGEAADEHGQNICTTCQREIEEASET